MLNARPSPETDIGSVVLDSSEGRQWTGLSAELRRHGSGAFPIEADSLFAEICIGIEGSRSIITRRWEGVTDQAVAARGTTWITPAGQKRVDIDISGPVPELLHLRIPAHHFSVESLGVDLNAAPILALRSERTVQDPLLAEIGFAIASELHSETSAGAMLIESLATSLAARLVQKHCSTEIAPPSREMRGGLKRQKLSRVLHFVEENLEGELTIRHLASIACLSHFHFARAFKAAVGETPHQYVSRRRLERAKQLLRDGDQSLAQIALTLNFSGQANFTRAFRRAVGRTPGEYRRNRPS